MTAVPQSDMASAKAISLQARSCFTFDYLYPRDMGYIHTKLLTIQHVTW